MHLYIDLQISLRADVAGHRLMTKSAKTWKEYQIQMGEEWRLYVGIVEDTLGTYLRVKDLPRRIQGTASILYQWVS